MAADACDFFCGVPTPMHRLSTFCGDNEIYMKRDDLIPFSFGGNKARIAARFFDDMRSRGCDAMVAYGSRRSNLARVVANMASREGVPCWIVANDGGGACGETANSRLVAACGARVVPCDNSTVAEAVERALGEAAAEGLRPYYIYGDSSGRGNEATPVGAYVSAYDEISEQAAGLGVEFDLVFCATGTGMTQAGLECGRALAGGREAIVGISVARPAPKELPILAEYADAYLSSVGRPGLAGSIEFRLCDDYLSGGYGLYRDGVADTVRALFLREGVPTDLTYVGKAFDGMLGYLGSNGIAGKRVLFVHTGGTPLFFDDLDGWC